MTFRHISYGNSMHSPKAQGPVLVEGKGGSVGGTFNGRKSPCGMSEIPLGTRVRCPA